MTKGEVVSQTCCCSIWWINYISTDSEEDDTAVLQLDCRCCMFHIHRLLVLKWSLLSKLYMWFWFHLLFWSYKSRIIHVLKMLVLRLVKLLYYLEAWNVGMKFYSSLLLKNGQVYESVCVTVKYIHIKNLHKWPQVMVWLRTLHAFQVVLLASTLFEGAVKGTLDMQIA